MTDERHTLSDYSGVVFVQGAEQFEFVGEELIMRNVGRSTIYFADRPHRAAGHIPIREFIHLWTEDPHPMMVEPVEAVVAFAGEDEAAGENEVASVPDQVVVLVRGPRLSDQTLTYKVETLEGTPPARPLPGYLFLGVTWSTPDKT